MKITLNPNRGRMGLSLGGVIMGILLIIVGIIVVSLLVRLAKLQPRQLPEVAEDELDQEYPGWGTNYSAQGWPVKYIPQCLDIITPDPTGPIYEKVFLANDFIVEKCTDGTLTNWVAQFHWIVAGSMGLTSTDENGLAWVSGFNTYSNDGVSYQMKPDYSGFDIQIDPALIATQQSMFWRSVPR